MMIKKYKKKPIAVEAIQWNGKNIDEVLAFAGKAILKMKDYSNQKLFIFTKEGGLWVSIDDYIIRGVAGEFYPCNKKIFEQTYSETITNDNPR